MGYKAEKMVRPALLSPEISINIASRLRKVQYTSVDADLNLGSIAVTTTNGDFDSRDLEKVVNTDAVNELVVLSWRSRECRSSHRRIFIPVLTFTYK